MKLKKLTDKEIEIIKKETARISESLTDEEKAKMLLVLKKAINAK